MRPPVLPSGNSCKSCSVSSRFWSFNEAAGFTQRKPAQSSTACRRTVRASMRPPVLPSGNYRFDDSDRNLMIIELQ